MLVGAHIAIVSLGLSCQTAHQMKTQAPLVSDMLSEPVRFYSSFFNYVLTPPHALLAFIDAGPRSFTAEDISVDSDGLLSIGGVCLFHDSEDKSTSGFEQVASKYTYLADKFWKLRAKRRVAFIVSNTQRNLDLSSLPGVREFLLSAGLMSAIRDSVQRAFPSTETTVHFIGDPFRSPATGAHLIRRTEENKLWEGDPAEWAVALKQSLVEAALVPVHTNSLDRHAIAGVS